MQALVQRAAKQHEERKKAMDAERQKDADDKAKRDEEQDEWGRKREQEQRKQAVQQRMQKKRERDLENAVGFGDALDMLKRKEALKKLCEATGVSDEKGKAVLRKNDWDVKKAIMHVFAEEETMHNANADV